MGFKRQKQCKRGHKLEHPNLYEFKQGDKLKRKCLACIRLNGHTLQSVEGRKKWQEANKERQRENARRWYRFHPEEAKIRSRENERRRRLKDHAAYIASKRKWQKANPEKVKWYVFKTRCRTYGITAERYLQLLEEQGHACAVCLQPEREPNKSLSIDHDHRCCKGKRSCGKCVRGLLCQKCNQGMGCLGDDPATFARASEYSKRVAILDDQLEVIA